MSSSFVCLKGAWCACATGELDIHVLFSSRQDMFFVRVHVARTQTRPCLQKH